MQLFSSLLPDGARVLDVGCGTGVPVDAYLVAQGFTVTGVDLSYRIIELARVNVPVATYLQGSMTTMAFNKEFDGIVASYSMLLLDPLAFKVAAKAIGRSLTRDGLCYVSLNEPVDLDVDCDEDALISLQGHEMYSRAYTKDEVMAAFHDAGMVVNHFDRRTITSELFGEEHMMEFLFTRV